MERLIFVLVLVLVVFQIRSVIEEYWRAHPPMVPPSDPIPAQTIVLTVLADALFDRASVLVRKVETEVGVSDEWKRHHVYAALREEFTDRSKHDIANAIQAAVQVWQVGT